MFKIYDGRDSFYQWDLDRKLIVEDSSITEVHFCNRTDQCSLVCETYVKDNLTLVNVPNLLLQTDWRINVYAYVGYTKFDKCFEVRKRTKPADYVYTETEIETFTKLETELNEKIDDVNKRIDEIGEVKGSQFANALRGFATGEAVAMTDISPLEHALKANVARKNLLPFPYSTKSSTINGITFTVANEGRITANGTATERADFQLSQNKILLKAGVKYTLSGCPSGGSTNTYNLRFSGDPTGVWVDYGEGNTFTPSADTKDYNFIIRIEAGVTLDNLVFEPMLLPNIDYDNVKLLAYGGNMLNLTNYTLYVPPGCTLEEVDNGFRITNDGTQEWGYVDIEIDAPKELCGRQFYLTYFTRDKVGKFRNEASYSGVDISYIANGTRIYKKALTMEDNLIEAPQYQKGMRLRLTIKAYVKLSDNNSVGLTYYDFMIGATTFTEYEPYKEPIEYPSGADIAPIYPTTTITTDTLGAFVECEYNRDLNKAFAEVIAAIVSLGANI